jgi:hypothetical protein
MTSDTEAAGGAVPRVLPDTRKSVTGRARVAGRNGGVLTPFARGQGQVPGFNKPAYLKESLQLARRASPVAVRTLIKHLDHEDGRIAVVAAERLLERAWGRPREAPPEPQQEARLDVSALSREELAILTKLVLSGRLTSKPVDDDDATSVIEAKVE